MLFRLRDPTPVSATAKLYEILSERETELAEGALILVEDRRYRVRRLPIQR